MGVDDTAKNDVSAESPTSVLEDEVDFVGVVLKMFFRFCVVGSWNWKNKRNGRKPFENWFRNL